ncbi:PREDICTED: kelch domain-containing protein 1-like [Amphimedon queenslandica]|uniref:Uncharacterized protein n=1 Tax=Amphimedon queenslandica TaxID=400682 RepID=A0A1X7U992_AMPQE|nr:PREDICTED: kelch domain-containing protein 1-like [Amphimedon queenslandica]|eukprot:XP_019855582.1 PREDICTED: kelch domain-containing protein 1-like [Amphimedon queenslandica]
MSKAEKDYEPLERESHSTVKVGDTLYMWGGVSSKSNGEFALSVMELYHLPTGTWEQRPTTGNSPLGLFGYAAAAIGNKIFYFGGYSGNSAGTFYNSLHCFNVDAFNWKEISPNNSHLGPMKKCNCGMVAVQLNGEDYLAVIGGLGSVSSETPKQGDASYSTKETLTGYQICNEVHYFKISTEQWMSPNTEDRPIPISEFSMTSVTPNSAILFGGSNDFGPSNDATLVTFTNTSVKFTLLVRSFEPYKRYAHSSALINSSSAGPQLLILGGICGLDCWLLDINKKIWKELVKLPDSITSRCKHSLSVWSVTPTTNWMIVFGGAKDDGISSISKTEVFELRYTNHKKWSTSVIPLRQYQEKLHQRREGAAESPEPPQNKKRLKLEDEEESDTEDERWEIEEDDSWFEVQEKELELLEKEQQLKNREEELNEKERLLESREKELDERERKG